jgi:hypothetical protein
MQSIRGAQAAGLPCSAAHEQVGLLQCEGAGQKCRNQKDQRLTAKHAKYAKGGRVESVFRVFRGLIDAPAGEDCTRAACAPHSIASFRVLQFSERKN